MSNNIEPELVSRAEACKLLGMSHPTFFRYYAKSLTTYRNAENPGDQRHFFEKNEVLELVKKRQEKKNGIPKKVVIVRKAEND